MAPVPRVVWLASVAEGYEASIPWAKPVPRSTRPAAFGASPSSIAACSSFAFRPSQSTTRTWSAVPSTAGRTLPS